MSHPDERPTTHLIHILPVVYADHESKGAYTGRYKLRCSREPGAHEITPREARETLSVFAPWLRDGQEQWSSIMAQNDGVCLSAKVSDWRGWLPTSTPDVKKWDDIMKSQTFTVLDEVTGLRSWRMAFRMYRRQCDFNNLIYKPKEHTQVTELSRFYQLASPWSAIRFSFALGTRKAAFQSDTYANGAQWAATRSALTRALQSVEERPGLRFTPAIAGRDESDAWRGAVGVLVGLQLKDSPEAKTHLWEPIAQGHTTLEGADLVRSAIKDCVTTLRSQYPEALTSLTADLMDSEEDQGCWIDWMELVAD